MTPEEKQLLIKDLCARLPYDVEAQVFNNIEGVSKPVVVNKPVTFNDVDAFVKNDVVIDIKPYLRPMESMTEEEKKELTEPCDVIYSFGAKIYNKTPEYYDWFNAHHFDYRGLIPKGLAIAVTEENNPYK